MKTKILKMLNESEDFLSGQQLCETFGVSRTAVWKVIDQLKKEGYEIEAVRNKGYRLVGRPDLLSKSEIESRLKTDTMGRPVVYYEETDSTNTRAKEAGEEGMAEGTLFVADRQSAGKGRRGRQWSSPSGENIYMTLLLRPQINPSKASEMTLLMALAVADGIKKCTGENVGIKWPNDVIIGGKKVCGILTEMSTEIEYINYVVIGVGINVNQETFPEEIENVATSLKLAVGDMVDRAALTAEVMESFERIYRKFLESEDLAGVREEYESMLLNKNQKVRVLEPGHEYEAVALGITETGELIVQTPDGEVQHVYAGEVSVRGVYGYV